MSASDSPRPPDRRSKIRRDGWTAERQLAFLAALERTRSVTTAARAVGMSRESAYRLRERPAGELFAALWDGVFQVTGVANSQGHSCAPDDRSVVRLLGLQYRRQRGDFSAIGSTAPCARESRPTGTL